MANPLDRAGLYKRYQKAQTARGLGSLFQEEGPGRTGAPRLLPVIDPPPFIRKVDDDRSFGDYFQSDKNVVDRVREYFEPKYEQGSFGSFQRDDGRVVRFGLPEDFSQEEISRALADIKNVPAGSTLAARKDVAEVAKRLEGLPEDDPIFAGSPLDALSMDIDNILSGLSEKKQREKDAEEFRAEEAKIADAQGLQGKPPEIAKLLDDSSSPDKNKAVEDTFMSGIDEMMSVLGREVPKVGDREELLQKYMQEFSEATGIPVEGKIDKSQALMALGLGLMQNRAGKGFNVGRILSSVGEAGQAAMPYLTKAKEDAKQARIAAGKYALEKIKSDEDASQAIETSNAALRQELILKNIDAQNDAKLEILKAKLEGKDVSQMPESIYNEEIKIGTNTYKVRMGINPSNLQPVFINPTMDADEIGTAYSKTISGLNTINEMEQLTNELIDLSRETPAGITGKRFLDSAKGVMRSMGMSQDDFFRSEEGKGLSVDDELDAIRRAFIMRFKRFISQETGNGISNVDVAQIEAASGALDELLAFKNPEKSLVAFKELRKLFDGSLQSLQPMITNFTDRDNYYSGEAGDKLYEKTMEKLNQSLGGSANFFTPTMVQNEDGSQTQTYDVRS
jgi:hypothetical protein